MSFTPQPYQPSSDAHFTPTQGTYKELKPFRYWCQKVLPLVYDDSLSYYELLCKVVDYLNKTMEDVDTLHVDVDNLHDAYAELETDMNHKYTDISNWVNISYNDLVDYVNTYFDNLDVQEEINNKLDAMAESGELLALIVPVLPTPVDAWLSEHITNPSNPPLDTTLLLDNAAARSSTVGDRFKNLSNIPYLSSGYTISASYNNATGHVVITITTVNGLINYLTSWGGQRNENLSDIPTDISFASVNDNTIVFDIPANTTLYWDTSTFKLKSASPCGNLPPEGIELISVRYATIVSGIWLCYINANKITNNASNIATLQNNLTTLQNNINEHSNAPYLTKDFNITFAYNNTTGATTVTIETASGKIAAKTRGGTTVDEDISDIPTDVSYATVNGNTITFVMPNNSTLYWDSTERKVKTVYGGATPINGVELLTNRWANIVSGAWLMVYNYLKTLELAVTNHNISVLKADIGLKDDIPYFNYEATFTITRNNTTGLPTFTIHNTDGTVKYMNAVGGQRNKTLTEIANACPYASVDNNDLSFTIPVNYCIYYDSTDNLIKSAVIGAVPEYGTELLGCRWGRFVSGKWLEYWEDYMIRIHDNNLYDLNLAITGKYTPNNEIAIAGIDTYLSKVTDISDNNYCALFFTDPHIWYTSKNNYTPYWLTNMQNVFNKVNPEDIVCGGDWLRNSAPRGVARYQLSYVGGVMRYLFTNKFHFVLGNHDTNIYQDSGSGSQESDAEKLTYQQVANLVTHEYSDTLYYKYETTNATIVVLNSGDKTNTNVDEFYNQFAWLADVLNNANKPVIIYAHAIFSDATGNPLYSASEELLDLLKANNDNSTYTYDDTTYDFTNSNSTVKAIICGHIHDYKAEIVNDIPIISCDNMDNSGLFYYVCADFDSNTLYIINNVTTNTLTYTMPS